MRVAIVGGGPRLVYALEALLEAHRERGTTLPSVTVFEPDERLGIGSGYATRGTDFFRLNVSADAVFARSLLGLSWPDWVERTETRWSGEAYPPRSLVGRFLAEAAEAAATEFSRFEHVRERAARVSRGEGGGGELGWVVESENFTTEADSVLLLTGHARRWPGQLPRDVAVPTYPAEYRKRPGGIGVVVVRGGALTAIDATLACTEGRGGGFQPEARRTGAVRYLPGAQDARRVTWVTRSGTLMSAKTELSDARRLALTRASGADSEIPDGVATREVVDSAARVIARESGARDRARADGDPERWLEEDILMARGLLPPDSQWARGQAWRLLYPALVRRHERWQVTGGKPDEGWADFLALAADLERLAFGPPLVNAEKVLALVRSGVLGFSTASDLPPADLTIDAVLAPPGIAGIEDPLWSGLLADGLVAVAGGRRGVDVDVDGTVLVDGSRREGLAAAGRATEDVILGNDTLNRDLHAVLPRWAMMVARKGGGLR